MLGRGAKADYTILGRAQARRVDCFTQRLRCGGLKMNVSLLQSRPLLRNIASFVDTPVFTPLGPTAPIVVVLVAGPGAFVANAVQCVPEKESMLDEVRNRINWL